MRLILTFFLLCSITLFAQSSGFIPLDVINTPYNEFSPSLSPDGRMLLFSSERSGGLGDQDIWISTYSNGTWSEPVNFRILNSAFHDQQPCFTHDGRGILFSSDRDGGLGAGDIYISLRTVQGWTKPVNLGAPINSKDSEKMPSLSLDNLELYFCRSPVDPNRRVVDDSKIRILRSLLSDDGWSEPLLLMSPVNVGAMDSAPHILPDERTLLFSSKRDGGVGGFDLWRVRRDGKEGNWTGLTNLSELNSEGNESHFCFDVTGKTLIVSRRIENGMKYDLYQYTVSESVMTPAITLQGRVTNRKNGDPLEASISVEVFGNTNRRLGTVSDRLTGKYSITLPGGSDYSFTVEKPGFLFDARRMDQKDLKTASITNIDFGLTPLSKGEVLVIPTIYFDPDSAQLRSDSLPALERVHDILLRHPALRFRITGHVADTPDQRQDPVALSLKRAEAVKRFLMEKGCAEGRLETQGMGAKKPVADNATPAGREQNRRTEFEVISD